MDFSESYHTRKEKLSNLQVPNLGEVRQSLGDNLSNVFFAACPDSLKEDMAIANKLQGPGDNLWSSPSDLLINKLVLKPPFSNKHIKALTHEGILEIGYEVELKLERIREEALKKALHDQEMTLRFLAARETEKAVAEAIAREQELFRLKLMQLNDEFEVLVQELLAKVEARLRETYEEMLAEETERILKEQEILWTQKIEQAVEETVVTLTTKFCDELEKQEREMTEVFNAKLEAQKEMFLAEAEKDAEMFEELLKRLKHNLQCNNIANLMYVLCSERRKCYLEQRNLLDTFEKKVEILEQNQDFLNREMDKLKQQKEEKEKKIRIREQCMLGVLDQFQKFINFALRANPTQAEFLLSVQKMMTFELVQAVAATDKKRRPVRQLMPWRTVPDPFCLLKNTPKKNVTDKYHDCLNELPTPRDSNASNDELLAITFNDKLYVREDFRNRVSTGIPIRKSSMIWNKEVENLISILKDTDEMSLQLGIASTLFKEVSSESIVQKQRSNLSSVHFTKGHGSADTESENLGILAAQDSLEMQKSVNRTTAEAAYVCTPSGCALLAVPDSLTVIKNVEKSDKDKTNMETVHMNCSHDTLNLSQIRKFRCSVNETTSFKTLSAETIQLREMKRKNKMEQESRMICRLASMSHHRRKPEKVKDKRSHRHSLLSKMYVHRDSLEILRANVNYEEAKVKDMVRPKETDSSYMLINMPLVNGDDKQDIDFSHVAEVYSPTVHVEPRSTAKVRKLFEPSKPSPKESRVQEDISETSTNSQFHARVVGNTHGNEHNETGHDFTVHRIHSIVDLLKTDDSLIRLFTRCHQ